MKSILVTGGLGFIGSHTCLSLLDQDYVVYIIDSLDNSSILALENIITIHNKSNSSDKKRIHFFQGDIRDSSALENVFMTANNQGNPIEAVIHFAGLKAVSESIFNPILYWNVNVKGTINLLKVMDSYSCKTIIYSSSATVYGSSNISPISENDFKAPINPYGQTKYVCELLLRDLFESNSGKWKVAILRYFNPIGAHPSGKLGEAPNGIPTNIFPHLCNVANAKGSKFEVFGNDWPTKDGSCIRDYIHVLDVADGHLAALNYLSTREPQIITINLGTGKGISVIELLETFKQVNYINFDYIFSSRRSGDSAIVYADIDLARSLLNWNPKRNLSDMCRDGWKWSSMNPNGYVK